MNDYKLDEKTKNLIITQQLNEFGEYINPDHLVPNDQSLFRFSKTIYSTILNSGERERTQFSNWILQNSHFMIPSGNHLNFSDAFDIILNKLDEDLALKFIRNLLKNSSRFCQINKSENCQEYINTFLKEKLYENESFKKFIPKLSNEEFRKVFNKNNPHSEKKKSNSPSKNNVQ
jgi:hypothetical protein